MYSLRRFLDPQTGAEYAYQAWYIENARRYTQGAKGISPGDPVEVELNERPEGALQVRARRSSATASSCASTATKKAARSSSTSTAKSESSAPAKRAIAAAGIEPCNQVLLDFREVGVKALDDHTIEMQLEQSDALLARAARLPRLAAGESERASKRTARPRGRMPRTSSPMARIASPSAAFATASGW